MSITATGSRRHNGYYAGDFTRTPMCTPAELAALAKLRPPTAADGRHDHQAMSSKLTAHTSSPRLRPR